jgi:hypothetical protein
MQPFVPQYVGTAYLTTSDMAVGSPNARAKLRGYTDEHLIAAYQRSVRDGFGEMFGHNARYMGNLIVDELSMRGIREYSDIFGVLPIRYFGKWDPWPTFPEREN